jgi:hypothetical protein
MMCVPNRTGFDFACPAFLFSAGLPWPDAGGSDPPASRVLSLASRANEGESYSRAASHEKSNHPARRSGFSSWWTGWKT